MTTYGEGHAVGGTAYAQGLLSVGVLALTMGLPLARIEARAQEPTVRQPVATRTLQARSFDMPLGVGAPAGPSGHVVLPPPRIPIGEDALNRIRSQPGARGPVTEVPPIKKKAPVPNAPVPNAPVPNAPVPSTVSTNCVTNSADGTEPSDIIGALGPTNMVVTTNDEVGVYNKSNCGQISLVTLSTFFGGASGETLFDPQVLWDYQNSRFIVTAESLFSGNTNQNQYFAISKDSTGTSWWVYLPVAIINGSSLFCVPSVSGSGVTWDYQKVGSVNGSTPRWMITANVYPNSGSVTASLLTIDKASTLTGGNTNLNCVTNFQFNLMPPNVMDTNSTAYLLSPGSGSGSLVQRYALNPDGTVTTTSAIAVPSWTAAPLALQPNGQALDPHDGGFEFPSIQNGTNIWNVHNIAYGTANGNVGLIRAYQFDTSAASPVNIDTLTTTSSSNPTDNLFNASIATNGTQAFINVSRTIPSQTTSGNAAMLILVGPNTLNGSWGEDLVATSTSQFTQEWDGSEYVACNTVSGIKTRASCRWGDYSAIQTDPSNTNNAWGFNQLITGTSSGDWTTRAALEGTTSPTIANNTHDFNGDGKSDILWRNTGGDVDIWLMNGSQALQALDLGNVPTVWSIVGQRDFNGDGKADILWRHSDGDVDIWFMNGLQVTQSVDIGNVPSAWTIVGTGDFNGDGKGDILWRNSDGDVDIWLMNGSQITQSVDFGNVPSAWMIAGVADFNGDGKSDILWRNSDGDVDIWFMNGLQVTQSVDIGNVPTAWTIVGTGDFNGDGKADILWRNSDGDIAIWLMNGSQITQSVDLGNVPIAWSVVETGDFNGDGKSDILWRNSDGDVDIWFMNGVQVTQGVDTGNVSTAWTVQGAGAD
jgi:FG-GAP-like repeat